MEEGPHGQRGLIGSQMEAVVDPAADHVHILAVLVGGHITVLDKLTHFLHLGVMVVLFQNRDRRSRSVCESCIENSLSFCQKRRAQLRS